MSISNGGDVAEQIVKVSINGAEQSIKLVGKGVIALAALLKALLESQSQKELTGKTNAVNLIKDGHEISAFVIKADDRKIFEQTAKDLAIPFCSIKDRNNPGDCNVLFRTVDTGRINEVLKKLNYNITSENNDKKKTELASGEHYKPFENSEKADGVNNSTDVKEIASSPEKFKSYLAIQTRMADFSANNQKLIYKAKPNASMVKTRKEWQALGRTVNIDANRIELYKPSMERENGKPREYTKIPYYDIADTKGKQINLSPKLNHDELTKFFDKLQWKSKIQFVQDNATIDRAHYNIKDGVITMNSDLDLNQKTSLALREKAHEYFASKQGENYQRETSNIAALAVAFSLCEKYGIEPQSLDMNAAVTGLQEKSPEEISELLSEVKTAISEISQEIDTPFELDKETTKTDILLEEFHNQSEEKQTQIEIDKIQVYATNIEIEHER